MPKIDRHVIFAEYWFDPRTGRFYIHGTHQEAGTVPKNGYRRITVNGRPHLASRLVWWMYHQTCKHRIDHLNNDLDDTRISNLAPRGGAESDAMDWRGYPPDRERSLAEMERWLWELQDFIPPGPKQAWPDSVTVLEPGPVRALSGGEGPTQASLAVAPLPVPNQLSANRHALTRGLLLSDFWFHAQTGKFFRKTDNAPAETRRQKGWCSIRVRGSYVAAHHLVFFMFYGYFPGKLGHRNGVLDDNWIENLVERGDVVRQPTPQWPATRPHSVRYLVPGVWWDGDIRGGSWVAWAPNTVTIMGRYASYIAAATDRLLWEQSPTPPPPYNDPFKVPRKARKDKEPDPPTA